MRVIFRKFHGQKVIFTRTFEVFFRFFHGRDSISRAKNENFSREKTRYTPKKKNTASSNILLVDLFYFVNNLEDHTLVTSWYQLQKFGKL